MYRQVCIVKYVQASKQTRKFRQILTSISRQLCLEKYVSYIHVQTSIDKQMYIDVQTSTGKDKKVKTNIEWASIDQNRHVFNSIGKNKDKST